MIFLAYEFNKYSSNLFPRSDSIPVVLRVGAACAILKTIRLNQTAQRSFKHGEIHDDQVTSVQRGRIYCHLSEVHSYTT
jgi:hypothetical protein